MLDLSGRPNESSRLNELSPERAAAAEHRDYENVAAADTASALLELTSLVRASARVYLLRGHSNRSMLTIAC